MKPFTSARHNLVLISLICLPTLLFSGQYFVLCEGNFGQANASLWSIDASLTQVDGPLIWDTSTDPLGDVGQSMTLLDHTLYLVMNNSHMIRKIDLETSMEHSGNIQLPGASPRHMAVHRESGLAYVSSWNLGALLVIDLNQDSVVDTLFMNALPEEILIRGDDMYVSITMESDWSTNNEVWHYDLSLEQPTVIHSYTVIDGPGSMVLIDDKLVVTSIYYNDAWESFSGTSMIDLNDHSVISLDHGYYQNYSADIKELAGRPYRTYGDALVPLNMDLTLDLASAIPTLSGIYAFTRGNQNLIISATDFIAPDPVHIYAPDGDELASFNVGALPGSFVYYDPGMVGVDDLASTPSLFRLGRNYPNPFNPTTSIPLTLAGSEHLSLDIIDLKGRSIRQLVSGNLAQGDHTFSWDGRDEQGELVSSGIFFARARLGDTDQVMKMNLLR